MPIIISTRVLYHKMDQIEQVPELQNQIKYLQTLVSQLTQGANNGEVVDSSEVVNK
jgi:hypothetical protein